MFEPEDPILAFSAEDQKKIADLSTKLSTSFKEFMFKYIIGSKGVTWEVWLKKAKSLDEDEYVKIYNDTYKKMGL